MNTTGNMEIGNFATGLPEGVRWCAVYIADAFSGLYPGLREMLS